LNVVVDTLKASDAAAAANGAQVQSERWMDRGPWLLLALLPLAALGFRRGWLMLLPLLLVARSNPAQANVWDDLWQRPDQQARAQLEAGKAKEAQALAASPELRGSAAYRAGDFAAASKDFESAATSAAETKDASGAEAQYNRGNALAKQNQYKEAIAAYDEALKRAPQMADAQANKQAIEEFLKQRQQDKQKQQQDSKDHQGDKQQKPGNDQPQDGEQGKDDKSGQQGKDGKEQKPSDGKDQDGKEQQSQDGKDASSDAKKEPDKSGNAAKDKPGDDKTQAKPPSQGSEAGKESKEQFQQSMDQALSKDDKEKQTEQKPQPVRLGAREGEQRSEQNEAVEQWLQRVPDDPGGLLRRKFQLEYQRRHGGAQENSQ
jgi:Ca-activated chloride channel family protein